MRRYIASLTSASRPAGARIRSGDRECIITGTVTDHTGAVAADVPVTVTNSGRLGRYAHNDYQVSPAIPVRSVAAGTPTRWPLRLQTSRSQ